MADITDKNFLIYWRNAFMQSNLPSAAKHILHVLSTRMDMQGRNCYPTIETISQLTGYSKRAVIKNIHIAEKAGWIKIKSAKRKGQAWKKNQYFAVINKDVVTQMRHVDERGDLNDTNVVTQTQERGDLNDNNVVTYIHLNSSNNSSINSSFISSENLALKEEEFLKTRDFKIIKKRGSGWEYLASNYVYPGEAMALFLDRVNEFLKTKNQTIYNQVTP